jgi:hypothetical protein
MASSRSRTKARGSARLSSRSIRFEGFSQIRHRERTSRPASAIRIAC